MTNNQFLKIAKHKKVVFWLQRSVGHLCPFDNKDSVRFLTEACIALASRPTRIETDMWIGDALLRRLVLMLRSAFFET